MLAASQTAQTILGASFCVHGFPFRLRTNVRSALDLFRGLYRSFLSLEPIAPATEAILEETDKVFAWQIDERSGVNSTLSGALWNLEACLCEAIIRNQGRLIALHAATVYKANSLLMLAGSSSAGKTTLTVALSRRGFVIAGDDVALIDPETLSVLPIPRCFHLDDRGGSLLEVDGFELPEVWRRFRFLTPHDLSPSEMPRAGKRTLILLRETRAQRPEIASLSQAEMTARLIGQTGKGPLDDAEIMAVISRLVSEASCFLLTPGPLAETAELVAERFRAPTCPEG